MRSNRVSRFCVSLHCGINLSLLDIELPNESHSNVYVARPNYGPLSDIKNA